MCSLRDDGAGAAGPNRSAAADSKSERSSVIGRALLLRRFGSGAGSGSGGNAPTPESLSCFPPARFGDGFE